jgi:hypothetical protein
MPKTRSNSGTGGSQPQLDRTKLNYILLIAIIAIVVAIAALLSISHPKPKAIPAISSTTAPTVYPANYTMIPSPANASSSKRALIFNPITTNQTWTLVNTLNQSLPFYIIKPSLPGASITLSAENGIIPADSTFSITVTVSSSAQQTETGYLTAYLAQQNKTTISVSEPVEVQPSAATPTTIMYNYTTTPTSTTGGQSTTSTTSTVPPTTVRPATNTTQNVTFSAQNVPYINQTQAMALVGFNGIYNTSSSTDAYNASAYFPPIAMLTIYGNVSLIAGWMMNYTNTTACGPDYCPTIQTVTYLTNNSKLIYTDLVLNTNNLTVTNATFNGAEYSYNEAALGDNWTGMNLYAWKNNEVELAGIATNRTLNTTRVITYVTNTLQ